jgi:hypothetical protein
MRSFRDAGAGNEAEGHVRLAEEKGRRSEWRWLGRATIGGTILGALVLWVIAYMTTGDDSEALISRGGFAFLAAVVGAATGAIAGFVLWALWVLARTLFERLRLS